MPVIHVLDPHVADMIAAGEVVERPASVIKELLENAFDAGAKNVTVELRGGGATYIRVSDDGCGMAPEDAGVAFLRHATSKLRDEKGLESIATMGFRGEALAAIAAVSRVELTTRKRGEAEGVRVTLEGGEIRDMLPAGCPEGTTMLVRDLFYNTPARLKFLKSDRSEATACVQTALRCALGRPEISVRCLRDGQEEFFSPGDGRAESCVYALFGRAAAADLLPCAGENGGVKVTGFTSAPRAARGNRREQYFFVNGRFIRSALLQAALEQAYRNSLLTGRYPSCALYLDMSCAKVDVNVHPAKTEVKFSDEKTVFDAVYYAVLSALEGEKTGVEIPLSASTRKLAEPKKDFYQSMSAEQFRAGNYAAKAASAPQPRPAADRDGFSGAQLRIELPKSPAAPPKSPAVPPKMPETPEKPAVFRPAEPAAVENPVQNVEKLSVPDHKIVGEALNTYLIVEAGGELVLIDKHAAHERMNFDRLRAQERHIMAQSLLAPVTLRPDGADAELLAEKAELLAELGFEIEPYGERDWIVRAVPAGMDPGETAAALEEICEKLRRGRSLGEKEVWDELLHTVACKAAIKAGWDTAPEEREELAAQVLSGRVKYCPHGRPVSVTVTRRELDKLFKRIV